MKTVVALVLVAMIVLAGLTVWYRGQRAADAPSAARADAATVGENSSVAGSTPQVFKSSLPMGPSAPDIVSDTWLNSAPLAPADLRGKVVLVEFWTFG